VQRLRSRDVEHGPTRCSRRRDEQMEKGGHRTSVHEDAVGGGWSRAVVRSGARARAGNQSVEADFSRHSYGARPGGPPTTGVAVSQKPLRKWGQHATCDLGTDPPPSSGQCRNRRAR
jgi:hypothetical protein